MTYSNLKCWAEPWYVAITLLRGSEYCAEILTQVVWALPTQCPHSLLNPQVPGQAQECSTSFTVRAGILVPTSASSDPNSTSSYGQSPEMYISITERGWGSVDLGKRDSRDHQAARQFPHFGVLQSIMLQTWRRHSWFKLCLDTGLFPDT